MFDGLNDGELATAITGESGTNTLTRQGLEEYVPTCVLALDHRIVNEVCTRRVRVVKSRGSAHGTNEYPFLMDEQGISILPIRALGHEP